MSGKRIKKRRSAYTSDILRTIRHGKRRFFSLLLITVLGVTMFSALQAACYDLRRSADRFFDQQNLHDLKVVSTLGLTEEDLTALEGIEGAAYVQPEWSLEKDTVLGEAAAVLEYRSFIPDGTDLPYVIEGTLPVTAQQAAVTEKAARQYQLSVGDMLYIDEAAPAPEEDETDQNAEKTWEPHLDLQQTVFTISAVVTDVTQINNPFGSVSYRTDSTMADTVFVLPEAFEGNYYTAALLRVTGANEEMCYTSAYEDVVEDVKKRITDDVKGQQETARTDQVIGQAQAELDDARSEAESEFADAYDQLREEESGIEEMRSYGMQIPEDAQQQIDEAWAQYESEKTQAEQEMADAQADIDEMKAAEWYVQDRSSLSGYANIESDADSIEAIGTVFPVVFFIVAILISLTTITRMVEENRSLIGTYKSLGFTDREIRRKYLIYAGCAGAGGSMIGTVLAFFGLPAFIFTVFEVMYLLPDYLFHFVPAYGIAGPVIFTGGILLAAALAVRNELRQVPASLMRPLAPRAGSRIFLERLQPIWKRLTFLQKVTARNLFRYKKRLLMTVFGIAGCTALMLFGFAIRDSVEDLSPRQYEQTFMFDVMSVAQTGEEESMLTYLEKSDLVSMLLPLHLTSADLSNAEGKTTQLTVMTVPAGEDIAEYVNLANKETGTLTLSDGEMYVTRNAANVLGLASGDTAQLKLADLQNAQIEITELTENYLGNYLYMTQDTYESYFTDFEINAALACISGTDEEQIAFTDALKKEDGVYSVTGVAELESQFTGAFMLINMVVVIIILMSAALAFVVLFTLASTNISERERELATIKVLGFFDPEVHIYINRETIILAGIGMLIGMPLGWLFAQTLTVILNLPSIYLAVSLKMRSYVYAVLLNVIFEMIVNAAIGRSMDRIDPAEALKSIE